MTSPSDFATAHPPISDLLCNTTFDGSFAIAVSLAFHIAHVPNACMKRLMRDRTAPIISARIYR
jgi:hypothetical protein